jgi:hypothetical protein
MALIQMALIQPCTSNFSEPWSVLSSSSGVDAPTVPLQMTSSFDCWHVVHASWNVKACEQTFHVVICVVVDLQTHLLTMIVVLAGLQD